MSQSFLPWWAILEVADGNVWHVDTNHCPPLSGTILRPSTCLHQRVTTVLIATLFSEIELLSIIIWARSIEMCTISNCVEMLTLKGSFAWYRNVTLNEFQLSKAFEAAIKHFSHAYLFFWRKSIYFWYLSSNLCLKKVSTDWSYKVN